MMRMNSKEIMDKIRIYWDAASDSEWYRSLRADEVIGRLQKNPESAFHPAVYSLIRKYLPELEGRRILIPSSGDNHAAFAFAMLGAHVTSADISERQLENASVIAERLGLDMEFICDDTMQLSRIRDRAYDMAYTSNGTLTWIFDIDDMYRNLYRVLKPGGYSVTFEMHPFNRPFSGEAWKAPQIVKSYHDVFPELHWRLQDMINSQTKAGLRVCEMAELPAEDASFWYTYAELTKKTPEEMDGINDWKRNPLAALPAWVTLISKKD